MTFASYDLELVLHLSERASFSPQIGTICLCQRLPVGVYKAPSEDTSSEQIFNHS